jgi:hypothetical protein
LTEYEYSITAFTPLLLLPLFVRTSFDSVMMPSDFGQPELENPSISSREPKVSNANPATPNMIGNSLSTHAGCRVDLEDMGLPFAH